MSQAEAREELADAIAQLQITGVNVYRYPVESPSVPCVIITEGDPVAEVASVAAATVTLNLRLVCLVPMLDAEASQYALEMLTDLLLQGLPRDRVQFSIIGQTSTVEVGEYTYYSREMPVSVKFRLGE